MMSISIANWCGTKAVRVLGVALVLMAAIGIPPGQAGSESNPRITRLAVSVMPEYDQPRVLVSYHGELNADVPLPLEVSLRIPADADIKQACSIRTATEEHVCRDYSTKPDGQYC